MFKIGEQVRLVSLIKGNQLALLHVALLFHPQPWQINGELTSYGLKVSVETSPIMPNFAVHLNCAPNFWQG